MATRNIYVPPDGDSKRLPHFSNLPAADELWEPLFKNLIEINFVLPTALQQQGRNALLMMYNAKNINFALTPTLGTSMQSYKFASRLYVNPPEAANTSIAQFDINFNLNQNVQNQVVIWNTLKAWYDMQWNSQDGTMNYKRDVVGHIIANQHDKRGEIIRRVIFYNVQILGLSELAYGWTETGIIEDLTASWCSDFWLDVSIDDLGV